MTTDRLAIAVWFSAGAASAVAAKLTVEKYGREAVRVLNCPIAEEHEDNLRFVRDVEQWLGIPVERVTNHKYTAASVKEVWAKRKFMSGPMGAVCTVELKKEARRQWEVSNPVDYHVLGFTADERARHDRFTLTERSNVLPILIDAGLRKSDCLSMLREAGIKPPAIYALGFPNANCIGCCRATSPAYWRLVKRTFPDVFADRARQSRELGARLVRVAGERLFLDELTDESEAKGGQMMVDFDCNVFCEEPAKPISAAMFDAAEPQEKP